MWAWGPSFPLNRELLLNMPAESCTPTRKNYATVEKEYLAIVWAIRKFRHYLIGVHFTIHTDHKPLEWLESSKTSKSRSQRLECWSLELRAFDFDIRSACSWEHQPECRYIVQTINCSCRSHYPCQ